MSLALLWLLLATPTPEARPNLLVNGGFEDWAPLSEAVARRDDVRNVDLDPAGQGPVGWLPMREVARDQTRTGRIALDEAVRHGGQCSARLTNGDPRDITCLAYSTEPYQGQTDDPHGVRPNHRYRLRWWVKGDNVQPTGAGPILMLYTVSSADGRETRDNTYEQGVELPRGTFDWQRREFVFITGAAARYTAFTLQLRWATGSVWYDDAEMVDLGAVARVETY
ncbi:MAG: hypothetical protein HZB16_22420 [Armatimonadetes bacterium]|nr:hypothetical protein [Armatimonadota bacterium]